MDRKRARPCHTQAARRDGLFDRYQELDSSFGDHRHAGTLEVLSTELDTLMNDFNERMDERNDLVAVENHLRNRNDIETAIHELEEKINSHEAILTTRNLYTTRTDIESLSQRRDQLLQRHGNFRRNVEELRQDIFNIQIEDVLRNETENDWLTSLQELHERLQERTRILGEEIDSLSALLDRVVVPAQRAINILQERPLNERSDEILDQLEELLGDLELNELLNELQQRRATWNTHLQIAELSNEIDRTVQGRLLSSLSYNEWGQLLQNGRIEPLLRDIGLNTLANELQTRRIDWEEEDLYENPRPDIEGLTAWVERVQQAFNNIQPQIDSPKLSNWQLRAAEAIDRGTLPARIDIVEQRLPWVALQIETYESLNDLQQNLLNDQLDLPTEEQDEEFIAELENLDTRNQQILQSLQNSQSEQNDWLQTHRQQALSQTLEETSQQSFSLVDEEVQVSRSSSTSRREIVLSQENDERSISDSSGYDDQISNAFLGARQRQIRSLLSLRSSVDEMQSYDASDRETPSPPNFVERPSYRPGNRTPDRSSAAGNSDNAERITPIIRPNMSSDVEELPNISSLKDDLSDSLSKMTSEPERRPWYQNKRDSVIQDEESPSRIIMPPFPEEVEISSPLSIFNLSFA